MWDIKISQFSIYIEFIWNNIVRWIIKYLLREYDSFDYRIIT